MTSLITLPNNHFAVQVENGSYRFSLRDLHDGERDLCYQFGSEWKYIDLPDFFWGTIVALGSEISEEQAGKVVDLVMNMCAMPGDDIDDVLAYCDYLNPKGNMLPTAIESFHSLLRSLSLSASRVVIINQNKSQP